MKSVIWLILALSIIPIVLIGLELFLGGLFPCVRLPGFFDFSQATVTVQSRRGENRTSYEVVSKAVSLPKREIFAGLLMIAGSVLVVIGVFYYSCSKATFKASELPTILREFLSDASQNQVEVVIDQDNYALLLKKQENLYGSFIGVRTGIHRLSKDESKKARYKFNQFAILRDSEVNVVDCNWLLTEHQLEDHCSAFILDLYELSTSSILQTSDGSEFQSKIDKERLRGRL